RLGANHLVCDNHRGAPRSGERSGSPSGHEFGLHQNAWPSPRPPCYLPHARLRSSPCFRRNGEGTTPGQHPHGTCATPGGGISIPLSAARGRVAIFTGQELIASTLRVYWLI